MNDTLVEEGAAFEKLDCQAGPAVERFDVVIVGGGQAGLTMGYHLARRGLRFLILDASARIGDAWRGRWDSLRLFTLAKFSGLDGMPFPAPPNDFPTKDAMGDYLEAYARRFQLPVRNGVRVQRLSRRDDGRYLLEAGTRRCVADQVVVAMSNYQRPKRPSLATELSPDVLQMHSADYRNPSQLRPGDVLLVGAGNSGAEIAMELARHHRVFMAGRDVGAIPFRIEGLLGKLILVRLVLRVLFHRLLTLGTPVGRKARPTILRQGGPLVRTKPRDLRRAGVQRVPRVVGVQDGLPVLADGRLLPVANVIWCTGFEPGFDWIDLPIFEDDTGHPRHDGGVVPQAPGLYFVGLEFLYSLSSAMIHGVGRDAARIADSIDTYRRHHELPTGVQDRVPSVGGRGGRSPVRPEDPRSLRA
jgi:putative flavoprotein involved in K+ transport